MLNAVIFDMDGVLVNSEPLWRKAMIKGFTELGINFTEDDCRKTTGKRFNDVVAYWINFHGLHHLKALELENRIVDYLIAHIENEGEAMPGAPELLDYCKSNHLKIGLATSSSQRIINIVLKKLNIASSFHTITSAEHLAHGKPHPEVFLACAAGLGVPPERCLVIEDSLNGVIAALAASMRVVAVPDFEHRHDQRFCVAQHTCPDLKSVTTIIYNFIQHA